MPLSVNVPFDPKRLSVFYGWVIAIVAAVALALSMPGQTVGFAAFRDVVAEGTGISVIVLSDAYLVGTIISGFMLPYCGRLFDRFGARVLGVVAALLFGVALIYMGFVDQVSFALQQLASYLHLPTWMGGFLAAAVGIFGIRFTGQGLLTMTSRAMLGKWFNVQRGFVLSVTGIGVMIVYVNSPPVVGLMIQQVGWQNVYFFFAAVSGLLMAAIALVYFRDNPEECGLEMDGGAVASYARKGDPEHTTYHEFTRAEALRTWSFWSINLTTGFAAFFITAFTFHLTAIGREHGMTVEGSLWLLAPIGYVNVVGSLIMAWATDRFRLKQINFVFALALAAHAYGATLLPSPLGFALLILGGGIATSIFQPLAGVTWPRFFGRKHIGAISGFNMSSMVIASALGPTVFIRIAEFTGNYQMPLYLSAVFGVALAFGSFWADNPQRRLAKSEAA